MLRAARYTGLAVALSVGTAPVNGAETASAKPAVFTLSDGASVAKLVTASGGEPHDGCFAPEELALQPVPGRRVGGVGTAWNIDNAGLLGLRDRPGGPVR